MKLYNVVSLIAVSSYVAGSSDAVEKIEEANDKSDNLSSSSQDQLSPTSILNNKQEASPTKTKVEQSNANEAISSQSSSTEQPWIPIDPALQASLTHAKDKTIVKHTPTPKSVQTTSTVSNATVISSSNASKSIAYVAGLIPLSFAASVFFN